MAQSTGVLLVPEFPFARFILGALQQSRSRLEMPLHTGILPKGITAFFYQFCWGQKVNLSEKQKTISSPEFNTIFLSDISSLEETL